MAVPCPPPHTHPSPMHTCTALILIDLPQAVPMPARLVAGDWSSAHLGCPAGASALAISSPTLRCLSLPPFCSIASRLCQSRARQWSRSMALSLSPRKRFMSTSSPGNDLLFFPHFLVALVLLYLQFCTVKGLKLVLHDSP